MTLTPMEQFKADALMVRLNYAPLALVPDKPLGWKTTHVVHTMSGAKTYQIVKDGEGFRAYLHGKPMMWGARFRTPGQPFPPQPNRVEVVKLLDDFLGIRRQTKPFPKPAPPKKPLPRSYKDAVRYMKGRPKRYQDKALLSTNVHLIRHNDGSFGVTLYHTEIVRYFPDGAIRVNTGHWKTPLTAKWINRLVPVMWYVGSSGFSGGSRYTRDNTWCVDIHDPRRRGIVYHFDRSITIGPRGNRLDRDI